MHEAHYFAPEQYRPFPSPLLGMAEFSPCSCGEDAERDQARLAASAAAWGGVGSICISRLGSALHFYTSYVTENDSGF